MRVQAKAVQAEDEAFLEIARARGYGRRLRRLFQWVRDADGFQRRRLRRRALGTLEQKCQHAAPASGA